MTPLDWLSASFGGIGVGFVAGLLVGAWQQRRVSEARDTARRQKEAAEAFTKAVSNARAEDGYVPDDESGVGMGHPGGPPPPSYSASKRGNKAKVSELFERFASRK
jgi:hypothetical protein